MKILSMQELERWLASDATLRLVFCSVAESAEQTVKRLQNDLRALQGRAEQIQRRADHENRALTKQECDQTERIYGQFEATEARLDELQYEAGLVDQPGTGRKTQPMDPGAGVSLGAGAAPQARPQGNPRHFANMFREHAHDSAGWRSMQDFFRTIGMGLQSDNLKAAAGQSEGTGGDGGFAVPSQFLGWLLDASLENEIVRPRARVIPAQSNIVEAPIWDDLDHTGGSISGFTAEWLEEAGAGTVQKAAIRKVSMRVNKLAIFTKATSELLEDGPGFETEFRTQLASAIGWSLDDAFLNGTGAGQPQGVLNAPSLIAVAKEGSQTADTVVYRNLKRIFARMHPASRMRAIWVAHNDTIPELMELFATDGTSSTHVPVLQEGGPTGFQIFTKPILFTEKVPQLGDQGDIGLYDFSRYLIAMRRVAATERSLHEGWSTDEVSFRTILRTQGQDSWDQAFQPKTGNTLGWAVTLAERA